MDIKVYKNAGDGKTAPYCYMPKGITVEQVTKAVGGEDMEFGGYDNPNDWVYEPMELWQADDIIMDILNQAGYEVIEVQIPADLRERHKVVRIRINKDNTITSFYNQQEA